MLAFFTSLSLMEFWIRYLVLFCLFPLIDGFELYWIGSLHKNIQLMMEFFKAPFLVLHFSCYTLMTLLMILSVILLSMLMILLSGLSVIRYLIYGGNWIWLLNLNLTYETLWTGARKCLVDFNAGKTQLVCLTGLTTLVLLLWKWMGLFLREKLLFKMMELSQPFILFEVDQMSSRTTCEVIGKK